MNIEEMINLLISLRLIFLITICVINAVFSSKFLKVWNIVLLHHALPTAFFQTLHMNITIFQVRFKVVFVA